MTFEEYFENYGPAGAHYNPDLAAKIEALFRRAWSLSEQNKNQEFFHTAEEFIMRSMCIPMLSPVSESRVMRDDEKIAYEVGEIIGSGNAVIQLCQVAKAAWGKPFDGSVIVITQDMNGGCRLPRGIQKGD